MNHEAGDGDLLATEDAEVLTALASPAPGKGREDPVSSIQLLTQRNRISKRKTMKEQSLKTLKHSFD